MAKNPYQMDLLAANKTKLYNQGQFWAFNTAKYRALLSNDPTVIKYFYRHEAGVFFPDVYKVAEMMRSFYYGDEFIENAEQFFGIIPMICESIAKMVCGSGYQFSEMTLPGWKDRLKAILEDNEFDTETLKASLIETLGLGSPAWHVHFDPELSDKPLIELVAPEKLIIKRKCGRIVKYTIKQQVIINDEPQPYELHTIYSKIRKAVETEDGVKRWVDDGIKQEHKIWNGQKYLDRDTSLKKKVFDKYGVQESTVIPIADFPVIYLPNTLNDTKGAYTGGDARPYGVVFGLESVSSALDEILSNCVDTIRKAFPFLLISEQMIPSDLYGDKDRGAFSTRRHSFVLPKNATEAEKLLQFIQAELNTTQYVEAAKFQINIALNNCGINAATLGLQLSGHVEAESTQNAKERNSIRTRNTVVGDYTRYLSKLFAVLLQYEDYVNGQEIATDEETGETAAVVNDYHGITPVFNKYIVDTPEEISMVLARKVQGKIMSILAAVREQHPEWDDARVYAETNIILAENGANIEIVPPNQTPGAQPPADGKPPPEDDPGGDGQKDPDEPNEGDDDNGGE